MLVSVAVNFTEWPLVEGFSVDASVMPTVAWSTVWLHKADVLFAFDASPLYVAVTDDVPTASFVVLRVATPAAFSVPEPRLAVPSLKVTVPVGPAGAPEVEVIVAVSVTDCP